MYFPNADEIANQLKKHPVFSDCSEADLLLLINRAELITLTTNQALFLYNDPSDSVYYLMDGHLECFTSDQFIKQIRSLHSGELIGEMGVLTERTRKMAAKVTRDSLFLKINSTTFIDFFKEKPDMLMRLTQTVAKRLQNIIMNLQETTYEYKNIGLISLIPHFSLEKIRDAFQPYMAHDKVRLYTKQNIDHHGIDIVPFFHQCTNNPGINLFFSTYGEQNWTHELLNHLDYVYIIVSEGDWDALSPELILQFGRQPCDLLIMHKDEGPYTNTARFYHQYPFKRHHHITDNPTHYQRIYRYMTGQAIGLVISGGGFRGFAHYGLIKALFEARVPIDYISGSSMGAAIGAILAIQFNWKHFDTIFTQSMNTLKNIRFWRHFTLPFISILNGSGLTRIIKSTFSPYQIEDLPTNFFCVVANLSESKKDLKKAGSLWEWLRAATSIPGIVPPFTKDGSVYVDGGVCTNLPVRDMRRTLNHAGTIIAFDLRIPPFQNKRYHFPLVLTFKHLIAYRLNLRNYRYIMPPLIDVLVESSLMNQYMYDTKGAEKADIMVAPDTSSIGFNQIKNTDFLMELSYELAREKLAQKKSLYERWIIN